MRNVFLFFLIISLTSCNYLSKVNNKEGKVIAKVGDTKLYKNDLINMLPKNLDKNDSILFAKKIINSWAKQELFFQNAKLNLSEEQNEIDQLVQKYKQDLVINKYKEALINKNLDTTITEENIENFYQENKDIFKLNEKLIQLRFLQTNKDRNDLKKIISFFESDNQSDLDSLHNIELEFKAYHLQDTVWIKFNEIAKKIKPFKKLNFKKLKKNKAIKIDDTTDIYLFKIFNILERNEIAPKEYVKSSIKQMILHDRKLKEQKNIEKTLLNDAIKNGKFQIYE
ncbi:MAG TPA: peptidyl-prolyl cis-trans isomerase [Flavobacteriia bacterium]|nr:peptidyl-prolyl cis-trans isomerase [Flavobacteriia bacterium]